MDRDFESLLIRGGIVAVPETETREECRHWNLEDPEDRKNLAGRNIFPGLTVKTILKKKRKKKKPAVKLDGEILEDFFSIQEFAQIFSEDTQESKAAIIPILSKTMAYSSTLQLLTDRLNRSDIFDGINHDPSILKDILKFWSMKELCNGLDIDFSEYMNYLNIKSTRENGKFDEKLFNMLQVSELQRQKKG